MLSSMPDKPRFMMFVLHSYTGSRQHLLIAAREMLTASALGMIVKLKTPGLELPRHEIAGNCCLAYYFEESVHSRGLESLPDKGERDHSSRDRRRDPSRSEPGP